MRLDLGQHFLVRDRHTNNLKTNTGLQDVSLRVKKGEIVGLLGLVGSGRTETLRAIFGADKILQGQMKYLNKEIIIKNPNEAIKNGIVMIPEDRRKQGLVLSASIDKYCYVTVRFLPKFFNHNYINFLILLRGFSFKLFFIKFSLTCFAVERELTLSPCMQIESISQGICFPL